MTTDQMLTVHEVAALFQVSRSTVDRWVKDGKLPAIRMPGGRSLRFRRAELEAFLEASSTGRGAA